MNRNLYSYEFKEQVIKECQETDNIALVARRHNISTNTIQTWLKKHRKHGTVRPLPKAKDKQSKALESQLNKVSSENDKLKRKITSIIFSHFSIPIALQKLQQK